MQYEIYKKIITPGTMTRKLYRKTKQAGACETAKTQTIDAPPQEKGEK